MICVKKKLSQWYVWKLWQRKFSNFSFSFQRVAPRSPLAIPALPTIEKLPRAPPLHRWKSGTCAVLKARSTGLKRTRPRDREPRPANRSTGSRGRGAWPQTRVRGGECTGLTTRLTSCEASSQRLTTTRSSPNMKLYRWPRFTSMLWLSCSRVPSHPTTAMTMPQITTTTRQSVTLCCQHLLKGRKTGLPHPL